VSSPQPRNQGGLSCTRGALPIDAQSAFVAGAGGAYRLAAALTFATVPALRQPGLDRITAAAGGVEFDLQGVTVADSAGLALLIDWLAEARARQRTLRYLKVPQGLSALAKLSDVEELIEPSAAPETQPAATRPAETLNATTTAARSP
jgi:phospholipid transport system transporter-binding protein